MHIDARDGKLYVAEYLNDIQSNEGQIRGGC